MTGVQRVLVANRGEIVVRIARTARRLGIATVAIHSDADRDAPHVRACDDALAIGGFAATESYLRIDRSSRRRASPTRMRSTRAMASSPRTRSSRQRSRPPDSRSSAAAAAIAAMGDKARARRRMAAAGIPVLPGYDGEAQDESTCASTPRGSAIRS